MKAYISPPPTSRPRQATFLDTLWVHSPSVSRWSAGLQKRVCWHGCAPSMLFAVFGELLWQQPIALDTYLDPEEREDEDGHDDANDKDLIFPINALDLIWIVMFCPHILLNCLSLFLSLPISFFISFYLSVVPCSFMSLVFFICWG